jgi:hypothetical protein
LLDLHPLKAGPW